MEALVQAPDTVRLLSSMEDTLKARHKDMGLRLGSMVVTEDTRLNSPCTAVAMVDILLSSQCTDEGEASVVVAGDLVVVWVQVVLPHWVWVVVCWVA
jgi:hypothetical protein